MMGLLQFLFVVLLLSPFQNSTTGTVIEGTVVQADTPGDPPISNAQIQFQRDGSEPLYTRTDSSGHFQLADVLPGQYRLRIMAAGYVAVEYGQRAATQSGTKLTIAPNTRVQPLEFKLVRAATITGRVNDNDGFPMADVPIQVYRAGYAADGRRNLTPIMFTRTNDRGNYRLYWLTPDEYYVSASPSAGRQGPAFTPINPNLLAERPGYPGWLYPGVPDLAHAIPVILKSGETRDAIDFRFTQGTTVIVSGKVIDQQTGSGVLSQLSMIAAGDVRSGGVLQSLSDIAGTFQFRGVASGTYTVSAFSDSGNRATKTIDVRDKDLTDLTLLLETGFSIKGQIRLNPDDPPMTLPQFSMGLIPGGGTQVQPDGSFEVKNVRSGNYTVYAFLPAGLYIQSARFGRSNAMTDLLPDPGEIRAAVAVQGKLAPMTPGQIIVAAESKDTLDIVVSSATGSLRGNSINVAGEPFPAARVVLVPEEKLRGIRPYYQVTTSDQNGSISLTGIPPGTYTAFAWDVVEPGAYFNRDFMRKYEERGIPVQIEPRKESTTKIPVISADGH